MSESVSESVYVNELDSFSIWVQSTCIELPKLVDVTKTIRVHLRQF